MSDDYKLPLVTDYMAISPTLPHKTDAEVLFNKLQQIENKIDVELNHRLLLIQISIDKILETIDKESQ